MGKAEKQQCGIGNAFFRSFLSTCSRSGQEMCQAATGSTWMSRSLVEDGDKMAPSDAWGQSEKFVLGGSRG